MLIPSTVTLLRGIRPRREGIDREYRELAGYRYGEVAIANSDAVRIVLAL